MRKGKSFTAEIGELADELNIPRATVERVLRARLAQQVNSVKRGESLTVEGLFTIKVLRDVNTGELVLRGAVSQALKTAVANDGMVRLAREGGV